jgi:tRNA(Ile)-lysidine synthase
MIEKIKRSIKDNMLLNEKDKVLLCVSGGADSVAMLSAFCELSREADISLYVAHLNHRLRRKDSDKDQEYVRNLSARYGLGFITESKDVKKISKKDKLSLEEAARNTRYDFFTRSAERIGANVIATAHTKDDQAETVIMHFLRGCGLQGLKGISPKSRIGKFLLIRPMLDVSRKEVESYLRTKKLRPRVDKSNLKLLFFRNRLRHKLIPLIEKRYSPRIKELLANLADILQKDYQYITEKQKLDFKRTLNSKRKNLVSFSLSRFTKLHISAQRMLSRLAIEHLKGNLNKVDYRHWKELEEMLQRRPVFSTVYLPGAIEVTKTKTTVRFCREKRARVKKAQDIKMLKLPGEVIFKKNTIISKIEKTKKLPQKNGYNKSKEYFDIKRSELPLFVRTRMPGDKMIPLGMKTHKKISDILIDEKISKTRRDNVPIVLSSSGRIIWLCGIRMAEDAKISGSSKSIFSLEIKRR